MVKKKVTKRKPFGKAFDETAKYYKLDKAE